MRIRAYMPLFTLAGTFTGAAVLAAAPPALAAPKSAPCAVCSVKEGAGLEPVKATAKHEGKEYYFCQDSCKKEFLADPAAFLKPQAPRPAPEFTLKDLNGKPVTLAEYRGKVVLLDFWATFCAPCVKAMPKLQKLQSQHAERGLVVLGIATDEEGEKLVRPMVAKTKVTYPILLDTAAAWKAYGVETLPALFLIDRKGQIVKRFGGGTDHKTLEAEVARLLGSE